MNEDAEFSAGFYADEFARFDQQGEDLVMRLLVSGNILPQDREAALIWLAPKAREAAAAREAIDRENRAIASSTKDAAWAQAREMGGQTLQPRSRSRFR
jgi:hypothetical protein